MLQTSSASLFSQSPCDNVNITCLDSEDASIYKCGTAFTGTSIKISELIGMQILLSANEALNNPQYIIFDGPVQVDINYTFASGSEIVFLSGGFNVEVQSRLQLLGTHVHGCSALWNGIDVKGELEVMDGCLIEDAVNAIWIHNVSKLKALFSEFRGNVQSIHVGDLNTTFASFSASCIAGCIIKGDKMLIAPFTLNNQTFNYPITGIKIENVGNLSIGKDYSLNPPNPLHPTSSDNIISDFDSETSNPAVAGIDISRSSVIIKFTKFARIDDPTKFNTLGLGFGSAIRADSKSTNSKVIIYQCSFEDCSRGILLQDQRGEISYCNFSNVDNGVFEGVGGISGFDFEVSNCLIEKIGTSGIIISSFQPLNQITLKNNQLKFNNEDASLSTNTHLGIQITNDFMFQTGKCLIENNAITNFLPLAPLTDVSNRALKAIFITNALGLIVKGNTISDLNTNTANRRFGGIQLLNTPKAVVSNNTINGSQLTYSLGSDQFLPAGIFIKDSKECFVGCNTTNNINCGISMDGMSSDATIMIANKMYAHNQGLYLENGTIIGEQIENINEWFGSANQIEGFFNFINYNPNNPDDVDFVKKSLFKINTKTKSSTLWANPRLVGTYDDSEENWFLGNSETNKAYTCTLPNGPHDLTQSEKDVFANTWTPFRGHNSTVWEASLHAFSRLYRYPELHPANSAAAIWYNANYNSNLGILARSYVAASDLTQTTPAIEMSMAALDSLLAVAATKNEVWASATNTTTQNQLLQEIAALNAAISTKISNLTSLNTTNNSARNAILQGILSDLNALTLTTAYEQDFAKVLQINLTAAIANQPFTQTQKQQLENIAAKCRIAGGYGVVLARSSLNKLDQTFAADANCANSPSPRIVHRISSISGIVWPNPTNNNINLQWEETISKATLTLFDVLGSPIKTWALLDSNQFSETIEDVPVGIYFLQVSIEGQQPQAHRIAISR